MSERFSFAGSAAATRALLVFRLQGLLTAFPADTVERVVPMAELLRPPGLPEALEGVLNLGGGAVPVVSLERLLRLPLQSPGLYSMLVILRLQAEGRIAVLVDRATGIVQASPASLRPLDPEDSFNGCAEAIVDVGAEAVHLLSPARLLLAKEREILAGFRDTAERRLGEWQATRT